ncbi:MAG: hypothetical protein HY898_06610 [Deltaproteobacteria bacterium]|nr:hypothetical protein [Deltaproteobacteria bacterium]
MRWVIPVLSGVTALALSFSACGGTVYQQESDLIGQDSGTDAKKDSAKDSTPGKDVVVKDQWHPDVLPDYADPGCPDAPPPIIDKQCEPLKAPPGDCLEGEACYPYVIYPSAPCEAETYGAMCEPAGTGQQNEPCYGEPCAPGHVCVITGAGTVCVQLCSLTQPGSCPDGLVCESIDVTGYGGCL